MEVVEGETLGERIVRGQRLPAAEPAAFPSPRLSHRAADCRRARSRARQGHRPPRPQAGQHQSHARRRRQGARLRVGQGGRDGGWRGRRFTGNHGGPHTSEADPGHGLVHEPGTGPWPHRRHAHRRVGLWLRALRDADRAAGFRRRHVFRHGRRRIEREPDWALLPAATPLLVRRLLRRSLAKDPKDRPRHMGDIGIELKDALQELATGAAEGAQPASTVVRRAPRRWGWAVATLAAVTVVAAYAGWQAWSSPGASPPLRAVPLTSLPGVTRSPSFSPDGNQVAFNWTGPDGSNPDIYVQQVGAGAPLRLTTDPGNDHNPMWSPDGRWIAFLRGEGDGRPHELRLVPPLTGSERRLAEVRPHGFLRAASLAWCPDSSCVVVDRFARRGQARRPVRYLAGLRGKTATHASPPCLPTAIRRFLRTASGWCSAARLRRSREDSSSCPSGPT